MYTHMHMTKRRRQSAAPTMLSIAEARAHLPALVRRAEGGEEIRITRRGVPVAMVRSIPSPEDERSARLRALIAEMLADPALRAREADPWAKVRDRSPGRPPPSFDR